MLNIGKCYTSVCT